jgi:hypothetical protein
MTMHEPHTYPPCNLGYGYNYNNNNNDGLFHVISGQRELTKDIYNSENDIRTHLDASTNALTANVTTVSRDVLNAQQGISKDISDVRYELSQFNNDISKQLSHLALENHKAESRTREEMLKGFASTQLDACKNTSELARQIAECCCETQKAILAQSASIRELDLSIENKRLQALVCHTQNNASNSNKKMDINFIQEQNGLISYKYNFYIYTYNIVP